MYVSLQENDESGTSMILSRSMSRSLGEVISLNVWLNLKHKCFIQFPVCHLNSGCASFSPNNM